METIINKIEKLTKKPVILEKIDSNIPIAPYQAKAGEVYMNSKQREHFRQKLLQQKRFLLEASTKTITQLQNDRAVSPDVSDRATQEETLNLELKTRDRERKLIRKLDEALHNLEAERYGYCDECGGHIGIQRLEARPVATLCIDCKTLSELQEKNRV
jgi:DnaK suppressor protein